MNTHFVELLFFEDFLLEPIRMAYSVKDRSIDPFSIPKEADGYRFFDLEIDYNSNPPKPLGKPTNMSSIVYFGKFYSLDELKKEYPYIDPRYLIVQYFGDGNPSFVKTKAGLFVPLMEGDIVISV